MQIRGRIAAAARIEATRSDPLLAVSLLAVSKSQSSAAMRELAEALRRVQGGRQPAFGENYVQEAVAKRQVLSDLDLEWHLIGPLQSNKCSLAAAHFDWVQSVDRLKLIPLLARARPGALAPLNVLLQVNIDDEASKSGCVPGVLPELAAAVACESRLRLRGLMAIPAPHPDPERRRQAFRRMHDLFETLRRGYPTVDTLSMGMSEDFELALQEGATLVRLGTALFGPREPQD